MSITSILSSDILSNSRTTINGNFDSLNNSKVESSVLTATYATSSTISGTYATSSTVSALFTSPVFGGTVSASIIGGNLAFPTLSTARVFRNTSTQSILTAVPAKIQLNAKSWDVLSEFDATTNFRFTATVAGKYQFNAGIYINSIPTNKTLIAAIRVNGSEVSRSITFDAGPVTADRTLQWADILNLNANDFVEMWVEQDTGSTTTIVSGSELTYLSIIKVA